MIYWSKEESCVHAPPGWLIQIQRTVRAGQTQQERQDAPGGRANRRRMRRAADLGAETEVIQAHHPSPGAFGPERARGKFPAVQHSGRTAAPGGVPGAPAGAERFKHQPIPRLISSEEADVGWGGEKPCVQWAAPPTRCITTIPANQGSASRVPMVTELPPSEEVEGKGSAGGR